MRTDKENESLFLEISRQQANTCVSNRDFSLCEASVFTSVKFHVAVAANVFEFQYSPCVVYTLFFIRTTRLKSGQKLIKNNVRTIQAGSLNL